MQRSHGVLPLEAVVKFKDVSGRCQHQGMETRPTRLSGNQHTFQGLEGLCPASVEVSEPMENGWDAFYVSEAVEVLL